MKCRFYAVARKLGRGLCWALLLLGSAASADTRLLMFEQTGCHYCERWLAEIGDRYHLSAEGKQAPLQRVMLGPDFPSDVPVSATDVSVTPTFVLIHNNVEVARLVGYAGDDFFWGQLQEMLDKVPSRQDVATQ